MKRDLSRFRTPRLMLFRGCALLAAFSVVFLCGFGVGVHDWSPLSVLNPQDARASEPADAEPTDKSQNAAYKLATHRQSYFKRDANGALELRDNLPFRSEGKYCLERTIHPPQTAIIIMDPWVDMAASHLNEYYGRIAKSRIVPFVNKALERGHPIIVLTNDPDTVEYNTNIHPELAALVAKGQASILYHQDLDDDAFADHLRSQGIDSLIYTGFASNMCVIGRRMGMIPMVQQGFRLFFVPQASAAVEYPNTWENQSIHHATTKIIAQWIADIVDYDAFMRATKN